MEHEKRQQMFKAACKILSAGFIIIVIFIIII